MLPVISTSNYNSHGRGIMVTGSFIYLYLAVNAVTGFHQDIVYYKNTNIREKSKTFITVSVVDIPNILYYNNFNIILFRVLHSSLQFSSRFIDIILYVAQRTLQHYIITLLNNACSYYLFLNFNNKFFYYYTMIFRPRMKYKYTLYRTNCK